MVYRLNINVMQSYSAIAIYNYTCMVEFFFIIPVFEHARTYLVQLATDRFLGRYLDAAGLDSINGRSP